MGIRGISHLSFIVRDLERTARLFVEGLGATEVYDSAGQNFSLSREKFFLLGGVWLASWKANLSSVRTAMWRSKWKRPTCQGTRRA